MSLSVKPFGTSPAKLYTFKNKNGNELTVTDVGASIVNLVITLADGTKRDVVLGYDSYEGYKGNASAHGATVGRYANRIGGASFELNGKIYQLDKNEGNNVLHGGNDKYFHRLWDATVTDEGQPSVTFHLTSPDGDQGMPGTAEISVTYSFTDDNEVVIEYFALADQDTVFNLTNHTYFNLDGHDAGYIGDQEVWLDADNFVEIDKEFIPTGNIIPLKGTGMNFTEVKTWGKDIDKDEDQIIAGNGYDHNYIINNPGLTKAFSKVKSNKTGIAMETFTDLPGVQVYSGNNMGSDSGEKDGAKYVKRGGFALETQYFPDSPNHSNFPSTVFKAGQSFVSKTIYKFSVE